MIISNFPIFQLFEGIWTAGVGSFTLTKEGICSNDAECINLRLKKVINLLINIRAFVLQADMKFLLSKMKICHFHILKI